MDVINKINIAGAEYNIQSNTEVLEMTDTTVTIAPNILYKWGEVEQLVIALKSTEELFAEYMIEFKSGKTSTTLALQDTVKFVQPLEIKANKIYQISIVNNLALVGEWEYE